MAEADALTRIIFFAGQGAFQAASVNPDAKLTLDRLQPLRHAYPRAVRPEGGVEREDLCREFVSCFGTALARKQAGETGGRQRRLSFVEGRS